MLPGLKKTFGVWQMDIMYIKNGYVFVVVETVSKKVMAKLVYDLKAETIQKACRFLFSRVENIKAIICDRGSENSGFKDMQRMLHTVFYFCDAGSPYQKGLVEQTNGILRKYLPRNTDARSLTQKDVYKYATRIDSGCRVSFVLEKEIVAMGVIEIVKRVSLLCLFYGVIPFMAGLSSCYGTLSGPECVKYSILDNTAPKAPDIPFVGDILPVDDYALVWQDEFTGTEIDSSKWTAFKEPGNNALQFYTPRKENIYVQAGLLILRARREIFGGRKYTSGAVETRDKHEWTYGIFEIRAKLPATQGLWPALWLLGNRKAWPQYREIDIMENLGHMTRRVYGTLHSATTVNAAYQNLESLEGCLDLGPRLPSFHNQFYVYTVVWTPEYVEWYVNKKLYHTVKSSQLNPVDQFGKKLSGFGHFDRSLYMILNVAVGGDWAGEPDESTLFPQEMQVDYVRIFQK